MSGPLRSALGNTVAKCLLAVEGFMTLRRSGCHDHPPTQRTQHGEALHSHLVTIACVSSPKHFAVSTSSHTQQDLATSLAPPPLPDAHAPCLEWLATETLIQKKIAIMPCQRWNSTEWAVVVCCSTRVLHPATRLCHRTYTEVGICCEKTKVPMRNIHKNLISARLVVVDLCCRFVLRLVCCDLQSWVSALCAFVGFDGTSFLLLSADARSRILSSLPVRCHAQWRAGLVEKQLIG